MRLFTALWPSEMAVDHLSAEIAELSEQRISQVTTGLRQFRFIPADRWHLTLNFHGDEADPDEVVARLDQRAAELGVDVPSPRLRLAGAGVFRSVLWVGVEPATDDDAATLSELVRIAGGDPEGYRGHLTIARWSNGRPSRALAELLSDYAGPAWPVADLTVVRSVPGGEGSGYEVVHRIPAGPTAASK